MFDLKPCPFCGGEAILETVDGNSPEECYIYCPHCKRKLGLMIEEQKAEKCPMCGKLLEWDGAENG